MQKSPPRLLSLVLVPALITLAVTVLRLVGEINGWNPTIFGEPKAGGDNALLGISWLIFVFGLWFGMKLQRGGAGPKSAGRSLLITVVGVAVVFGGMAALQAAGLVSVPSEEQPGEPSGMGWFLGLMAVGCAFSLLAWGRAALVMLLYAILARVPVVLVTWIALGQDGWDTHYTKVPEFFLGVTEADRTSFLIMPQVTFWPAITVIFGTMMASLGALLFGARNQN